MHKSSLLIAAILYTSAAAADESCQALADKIASEYATAHNMSAVDRTAKCQAYTRAYSDTFKESEFCTSASDQDLIKRKIQPVEKLVVQEIDQFCGGN